jgi:hypothetical protein
MKPGIAPMNPSASQRVDQLLSLAEQRADARIIGREAPAARAEYLHSRIDPVVRILALLQFCLGNSGVSRRVNLARDMTAPNRYVPASIRFLNDVGHLTPPNFVANNITRIAEFDHSNLLSNQGGLL